MMTKTVPFILLISCTLLSITRSNAEDSLPRVLIIGDSIYNTPAQGAANILQGRVEVVSAKLNPGENRNSSTLLESLDEILGEGKWDLIHFNVGLGDLVYRAPGMETFRVFPKHAGGVRTTSPDQYEKNLRKLVEGLKATGSKLIWASTTPIRHSASGVFEKGSEIEYNSIATKVMQENKIPINDMNAYALTLIDMDKPAAHGVDPFFFDRKPMYPPIVRSILRELDLIRPVNGPVKVFIMLGGWSHIGGGTVVDPVKPRAGSPKGTLDDMVLNEATAATYSHLLDKDGKWATRPDVWLQFDRRGPKSGTLGIGYGGQYKRGIGSELSLGHVLGNHFDKQVCIIKTTLNTPSLATDLQPPSTGKTGPSYTLLTAHIKESLAQLQNKFPDYTEESGYEIAGLVINLGEQDKDAKVYAEYLPMLINDLRKDLETTELPVVIAATGSGGREKPDHPEIIKAQQSVAALPQFKNNVTYVETRDFWPPENARNAYRHPSQERWYDNAESFYKMGEAIGAGLLKMVK